MAIQEMTTPPARTRSNAAINRETAKAEKEAAEKTKRQEEGLASWINFGSAGLLMFGLHADAGALYMHAEPMSQAFVAYASTSERMSAGLDYLGKTAPLLDLAEKVLPCLLQLAANHNMIKPEMVAGLGVVRRETVIASMQTVLMERHMEALQKQQEAEEKYMRMQAEMQARMNPAQGQYVTAEQAAAGFQEN